MSVIIAEVVPHPPIIIPEIGLGQELEIKQTTEA